MFDVSLEKLRSEGHRINREKNKEVIKRWLDSIGFSGTIVYDNNFKDFTIYTTRPGLLIGERGKNLVILKNILNEVFCAQEWNVKIFEIHGEFVTVE